MLFQHNFQSNDFNEKGNISCHVYNSNCSASFPSHSHSYYEISYVFSGERYQECKGKWYKVGSHSLCFIPPLYIHANNNITDINDMVIQFKPEFLSNSSLKTNEPFILEITDKKILQSFDNDIMEKLKELSLRKEMIKTSEKASDRELLLINLKINSLIYEILYSLIDMNFIYIQNKKTTSVDNKMFDSIINDILLHPDNIPDMDTAAKMCNMSYYVFSRHFHDATGFNYSEYCNILRIRHAEDLLSSTDIPISDIAESIGIQTWSYFCRLFKKLNGVSPREYRKKYKKQL